MLDGQPDHILVWTEEGQQRSAADVAIAITPIGFDVNVASPNAALTQIALRWKQTLAPHMRILGDHWERGYGDLEWRGFVPERVLPWYTLLFDPKTGTTTGIGVATGAASFASWRVDETGITLILDVRNGGKGVHLGNRTLHAASIHTLVSQEGETPFAFARRFCALLCPKPHLPAFPVYGGNDWYYAYGNNSDASIRRDAALMRDLAPNRDNAPFMVIDAGWFPARGCNGGPYDRGYEGFPDMPGLAEAMRAMEVRPGIWIRPLLAAEAPDSWRMPAEHPIWKRESCVVLDPSVPEVLELVRADIARLRAWGYTLIKHDFTTYDITGRWGFEMMEGAITSGGWNFADRTRTTAEIVRDLYQTIRTAAQEVVLIGCNTVGHLGAGLFELQRTGDDTSGREWERTRKIGINTLAFRMAQHDTFFAVDADCVGLTNHVPWELNKQWLELLAASGTPLFVSADPAAVGPDQRAALTAAFAHAATVQPAAEPLDWLHTTAPRHWRFGDETREFAWMPENGVEA
jgi:alpha-galactosidase